KCEISLSRVQGDVVDYKSILIAQPAGFDAGDELGGRSGPHRLQGDEFPAAGNNLLCPLGLLPIGDARLQLDLEFLQEWQGSHVRNRLNQECPSGNRLPGLDHRVRWFRRIQAEGLASANG